MNAAHHAFKHMHVTMHTDGNAREFIWWKPGEKKKIRRVLNRRDRHRARIETRRALFDLYILDREELEYFMNDEV